MTKPDDPNTRRSSLPPEEEAVFDSLFDRLTDASLRPADPNATAAQLGGELQAPTVPEIEEPTATVLPEPAVVARVSTRPIASTRSSRPPVARTVSSVPPPDVSLRPSSPGSLNAARTSQPPRDGGAETARRTVRKRAGRRGQLAFVGRGADVVRARAGLLAHLAQRDAGSQRARLWTATAELHAQLDEHDVARALRTHACVPEGIDLIGLRASQRDAVATSDWARAIELLTLEASLPLPAIERAIALTTAAEIALSHQSDPTRAAALCQEALTIDAQAMVAALLLVSAQRQLADTTAEAAALSTLAHAWRDPAGRVSALTLAGRAHETAGAPALAFASFEAAQTEAPNCADAAWGVMRTARAAGKPIAGASAATTIARGMDDDEARSTWLRAGARVAAFFANDAPLARGILANDHSRLGLRMASRIAALGDDRVAHRIALERWAHATGGSERALALVEMARLSLENGDFDAAEQSLGDAAIADGNLATVRVVRELLARKRGDTTGLANAITDDDDDALIAAAKIAADPAQARQERELLRRGSRQGDDALTADVVALDADALAGDREAVYMGVLRKVARARPDDRVGPLLALLDYLPADEWGSRRAEIENELRVSAPQSAVALRQRTRSVTDPSDRAAAWRAESEATFGEHAAFCATVAGDVLTASELDGSEAYRVAIAFSPLFEPAAWALERIARANGDTATLADLQERLAQQSRMPMERAGRFFRAGLLQSTSAPVVAADRLRLALTEHPGDPITTELLLRLSAARPAPELAELLLASTTAAGLEAGHAGRVRAGALLEDAKDWTGAAKHYRTVLDATAQTDPFSAFALDRAELLAQEHVRIAQRRTDTVRNAEDNPSKMVALSQLAEFERDRGDMQSAVLALQALREVAPYNIQTMRTLERYYLDHQRDDELNDTAEGLIDGLAEPTDVAAYLRFRVAIAQEQGAEIEQQDALLEDRVVQTGGDLWSMRREESAARRAGDSERRWRAVQEQIPHLTDPMERASLCLRAMDASPEQAPHAMAALLSSAVGAAPTHPIASEELARLHEQTGDHAGAAMALEIAARAAFTNERRASLWYRAGALWHDHVNDDDRALAALQQAATIQLLHRDTFSRLHMLLSARSDREALGTLIERRIAAGGDASLLAGLHAELSTLRSDLKDHQGAKDGLRAALALDATNTTSWHALAELQLAGDDWSSAADSLIQLARLSKDQAELRWAFFTLGDLYENKLPDLKRAEISFSRVVKLAPDDDVAIDRLAKVFVAQGQLDMAERATQRLCDLRAADRSAWIQHRVELAGIVEQRGDLRRAEGLLEETRRKYPLELPINRAIASHHGRQNDDSARAMHLSRSVNEYRSAIQHDAGDANAWLGLVDMLDQRGKRDAADLCAHVAYVLDVEAPSLRERKRPVQAPAVHLIEAADDMIAPEGLTASTRLVLRQLGPVLEKLLAIDTRGPGAERAKAKYESAQRALTLVATWMGTTRIDLYVNRTRSCHVSDANPWAIAVGESLLNDTTDSEKLFLFARALKVATSDLLVAVRTDTQIFGGAMHGLIRHIDVSYEPAGADLAVTEEWARRIAKAVPRKLREDIAPNVLEMAGDRRIDPSRLGQVCDRFGARAALVATGDFASAVTALLRESNATLPKGNAVQAQRALAQHPIAGDLLTFALSDACFSAREITLSSTAASRPTTPNRQAT